MIITDSIISALCCKKTLSTEKKRRRIKIKWVQSELLIGSSFVISL